MSDEKSLQDDLNEMLGDAKEEVKKAAKEKMRKINEAYDIIKKERGIN